MNAPPLHRRLHQPSGRTRPTPPSVLSLGWRPDPQELPPLAAAPPPDADSEAAALWAELRWTAGCMLAGLLLGTLIAAAIWGPGPVLRAAAAAVTWRAL